MQRRNKEDEKEDLSWGACRAAEELILSVGARIAYFQGDVKFLVDDIGAAKPTLFIGVPRVFDRIYSGVKGKIAEAGGIKAFLFNWGYARKAYQLKRGVPFQHVHPAGFLLYIFCTNSYMLYNLCILLTPAVFSLVYEFGILLRISYCKNVCSQWSSHVGGRERRCRRKGGGGG